MKLLTVGEQIVAPLSDGYTETSDHFNSAGVITTKYPGVAYTVVDVPGEWPWDFSTVAYVVRGGKLVYAETFKANNAKRYENKIRGERDSELGRSDWTQLPDAFSGDAGLKAECAAYRQALRDITSQAGFPFEVEWPVRPEPLKLLTTIQRLGDM